jgi:hypothetical protein
MFAPLPHRIRRLHWQARAPTADDACALRAQLREFTGPVQVALDQSLSAHAPDGRLIHLPRLELHLRLKQPFNANELAACITQAATEALGELTREATASATAASLNIPPWSGHAAAASGAEASSLAIDDALQLDALLRDTLLCDAPATLRAVIIEALERIDQRPGNAAPQPGEPPVALEISGQVLHLPLARLRELARLLTHSRSNIGPDRPTIDVPTASGPPPSALGDSPSDPRTATKPEQLAHLPDGPLPAFMAANAAHAQTQLATYLLSGSLDWTLAGLESTAALHVLRTAALLWVRLGTLPACLFPLPAASRISAIARWLALLPRNTRQTVIATQTPGNDRRPLTTALRELLSRLATYGDENLDAHAQALWLAWSMEAEQLTDEAHASWCSSIEPWVETRLAEIASATPWTAVLASLRSTARTSARPPAHPSAPAAAPPANNAASPHSGRPSAAPSDTPGTPPATTAPPWSQAAQDYPGDFTQRHAQGAPAGLVVPAAGLVLLHPYLPRLLDATGLYPKGSKGPIPNPLLPRATALLHWLASGRNRPHEFELPFIKLILGHAPDAPLSHAPPALNANERAEAGALLDAVLAHWQALRGTSADGLRTSFLQRRGTIERRDATWRLRVESESFDMLIGLLPWGLGLVRLPWMTHALFSEWSVP